MRIAIVADDAARAEGDCSRDPYVLTCGLRELGHHVTLLVMATADSATRAGRIAPCTPDAVLSPAPPDAHRGLASLLTRPDVVLSTGMSSPTAAAVLADSLGVPLVICPPAELFGSLPAAAGYGRLVCRHLPCACLIVECDRHGGMAERFGAERHKIFVVARGIRLDCYPTTSPDDAPSTSGQARILFDATRIPLDEQRFLEGVLTRLATERRRRIHTTVLTIPAASGDCSPEVRDLWCDRPETTLAAADYRAAAELYRHTDIVVMPSATIDETTAALRAMAAGRPLVAADCPFIRDVVSTARHGVLARPGWAGEWVDKLDYLLGEAAVRLHIGKNARARVETTFSLPQALRQLDDRLNVVTASWRYDVAAGPTET